MPKLISILLLLLASTSWAQKGILLGNVSSENKEDIEYCTIYIKETNTTYTTNKKGHFKTGQLPYGTYSLLVHFVGYESREQKVVLNQPQVTLKIQLKQRVLQEVEIEGTVNKSMGSMKRLRAIDGVLISQGKKNEVIQLEQVNANKATNQGRQIYSRIPGLNIWESDGAGIQLGIGGRGLNPSRTANFNTRQNGYDISADALGYPESYYTPPAEAIKEIQLIRGAASLQFGTQFGGLLNFILNEGTEEKPVEVVGRYTVGSFGLRNAFVSIGGTKDTWNYYGYFQHKTGDDWRPNSSFEVFSGGLNLKKQLTEKTDVRIEYTKMQYLTQQAGGLTDLQFYLDPAVSFRDRNWFEVDWNLGAVTINHELNAQTKINSRFFGLLASRKALGFLGQINRIDPLEERDLISGEFKNFGNETRLLHVYQVKTTPWALLLGARYYQGYNLSQQGLADSTNDARFEYLNETNLEGSSYEFPSKNMALFGEHIFNLNEHFSITPGIRYEYISTRAQGYYNHVITDLAQNVILDTNINDLRKNQRSFVIGGIGLNYKFNDTLEVYANFSQNYRSINFTDMQIQNPNFRIDPNLEDEKGYNVDFGIRGFIANKLNYDISLFALLYDNRIGTTIEKDPVWFNTYQYRTNVSASLTKGVEAMVEVDLWKWITSDSSKFSFRVFGNASFVDARYINSDEPAFENKEVELVPPLNFKTGATIAYQRFSVSYQYAFTERHYSDATNSEQTANAVNGLIPAYSVMDLSLAYGYKMVKLEAGVNNLGDSSYFTRRATGYPGPGIIPSPPRNFYVALQIKI